MQEQERKCPFPFRLLHPVVENKNRRTGTRYPDHTAELVKVLQTDIPYVMAKASSSMVQNATLYFKPDISDMWVTAISKEVTEYLGLTTNFKNYRIKIRDYLRGLSPSDTDQPEPEKWPESIVDEFPTSWLPIMAEGGLFGLTGNLISEIYLEANRDGISIISESDKIISIAKDYISFQNFSIGTDEMRIVCKGKGLVESVVSATALNLLFKKNGINHYIEPFKNNGTRRSMDEIFKEYQQLSKTLL